MNKSRLKIFFAILILGLLTTACTGVLPSSWPGVSVTTSMAYVSDASFVYAIKIADGSLAWKYPTAAASGQSFYAAPILTPDGSQLLVGDYSTNLYSLDPVNGTMKWTFSDVKGRWIGSPLVLGSLIYAPCADNNLYALDFQGKKQWSFNTNAALWSQPVTDGKTIYLASMDHFLYAIQPADGKLVWKVDTGGAMVSSPLLDSNGILYVGTMSNEMVAVQSSDGKILWKTPTAGGVWAAPVINNGTLYFGDQTGVVYAVTASDGKIAWQQSTGSVITGSMVIIPGGLVYGDEAGTLSAIDYTGKALWPKTFNGKLYSNLVYQSGQIYVAISSSSDSLLVALDTSGNQKWGFVPPK